jgi:hypothetical protein|tara:strand:+ start:460 stop:690 length:231 start_codon:yes stop_codon:yes gene_type:complete
MRAMSASKNANLTKSAWAAQIRKLKRVNFTFLTLRENREMPCSDNRKLSEHGSPRDKNMPFWNGSNRPPSGRPDAL